MKITYENTARDVLVDGEVVAVACKMEWGAWEIQMISDGAILYQTNGKLPMTWHRATNCLRRHLLGEKK